MTKFKSSSRETLAYIAGFLDGDGSINAQIVRRDDYRLLYQIRVSVTFFQSTKRHWFLTKLKDSFGSGQLRKRDDGISELALVGVQTVTTFVELVRPFLRLKHKQADIVLEISNKLSKDQSPQEFIELCKKVDLLEALNDSKKRKIRAADVEKSIAGQKDLSL